MRTLSFGARGVQVQLLQLALERAGFLPPGQTDGIFGRKTREAVQKFQSANGLAADGIAGALTHAALMPYYMGYVNKTIRRGDTFYRLAQRYGSTVRAIEIANPGLDPLRLPIGGQIIVPLGFAVVPTTIGYCSELIKFCCRGIAARYPFVKLGTIGSSVLGRPLWSLTMGRGNNRVLYNASHHANEWITTPLLLKFVENYARAVAYETEIFDMDAPQLFALSTLCVIPAVNPDGIDLVTGDLQDSAALRQAEQIAADFPAIPFPSGWKANIRGVDLNLQYPAGWEQAREIKFAQGYTSPAPRDYVGTAPASEPESRAMFDFTLSFIPALTLSYHTQGQVIYWKYLDYDPPRAYEIAQRFAEASGYLVEETPYASGFAGYKDWFIQSFNRPGYTIEAGLGTNPLPISDFPAIYEDNLGILTLGLTATLG